MIFFIIELILIKNSCLYVLAYLKGLMITKILYFYQGNMTNFFDVLRSINITAKSRISISYNREVGKNSPFFLFHLCRTANEPCLIMKTLKNHVLAYCLPLMPCYCCLQNLKINPVSPLPPPNPRPPCNPKKIQYILIEAKAPRPLSSVSATFPCLYMCSDCCIVYTAVAVCLYSV